MRYLLGGSVRRKGNRLRIIRSWSTHPRNTRSGPIATTASTTICSSSRPDRHEHRGGDRPEGAGGRDRARPRPAHRELQRLRLRAARTGGPIQLRRRRLRSGGKHVLAARSSSTPTTRRRMRISRWWHNLRIGEGRSDDVAFEDAPMRGAVARMRAAELDPRDAWALSVAGHIQSFQNSDFAERWRCSTRRWISIRTARRRGREAGPRWLTPDTARKHSSAYGTRCD